MFVTRPDARIKTFAFGGGPRTILAVGGWIGSGEVWLDTLGPLSARWRTITYDHRGTGASTCGAERLTVADMVDDLFAVMDAHGVGRCVLAAESSGAGSALEAVLRAPERFDGVVTVGGNWLRGRRGQHDAFIAALRADYPRAIAGFVDRCFPEPDSAEIRRWGRQILMRASPEHAVQLLENRDALSVEDRLGELRVSLLALHGALDAIVPVEASRVLARGVAGARLVVFDDLGHVPVVSAPHRVVAEIDAFFGREAGA